MLRTNKQTDKQTNKQTDSKILPTPTDKVGDGVWIIVIIIIILKALFYDVVIIEFTCMVHLINAGQRQAAGDAQTKPTDLGRESACRLLLSDYNTSTIVI